MRWNRVERKVKWSRPAPRCVGRDERRERERNERKKKVLSNQVVSRVQDFELAILFDVSRRLQLSKNEDAFLSTLSRRNHRERRRFLHRRNYDRG